MNVQHYWNQLLLFLAKLYCLGTSICMWTYPMIAKLLTSSILQSSMITHRSDHTLDLIHMQGIHCDFFIAKESAVSLLTTRPKVPSQASTSFCCEEDPTVLKEAEWYWPWKLHGWYHSSLRSSKRIPGNVRTSDLNKLPLTQHCMNTLITMLQWWPKPSLSGQTAHGTRMSSLSEITLETTEDNYKSSGLEVAKQIYTYR